LTENKLEQFSGKKYKFFFFFTLKWLEKGRVLFKKARIFFKRCGHPV